MTFKKIICRLACMTEHESRCASYMKGGLRTTSWHGELSTYINLLFHYKNETKEKQELWCLQIGSPFSSLLCLFRIFCGSMQILEFFPLFLWKNAIGILTGIKMNLWTALRVFLIHEPNISLCVFNFFHQWLIVSNKVFQFLC